MTLRENDLFIDVYESAGTMRLGHHNWWTAWPQRDITLKWLSQGRIDILPGREANRKSATFR